ncbi:MAG: hypothetical protein ACKVVP_00145 [Chloroflexota bacterium]
MPVSGELGPPSLAALLDRARALMVEAWDRNERPEYLLVHPALYDAVLHAKAREHSFGRPIRLLGLLVVSSATVEVDLPQVR